MKHTTQFSPLSAHGFETNFSAPAWLPEGGVILPPNETEDLRIPIAIRNGSTKIGGADINLDLYVPDNILYPNPMLIVNGFCGSKSAYIKLADAAARNGRVVGLYDAPRMQEILATLDPRHVTPDLFNSQVVWGATRTLLDLADKHDLGTENEVDVAAHSMGGAGAVNAALHMPEYYRTILLNEAAGLEKHNVLMMLKRLYNFRKELPGTDAEIILGAFGYIFKNPLKTSMEALSVATCDIREDVKLLKHLGQHSVKSAILMGASDRLILAEAAAKNSGAGVADLFALYPYKEANHLYLQRHPLLAAKDQETALRLLHNEKGNVVPELLAA